MIQSINEPASSSLSHINRRIPNNNLPEAYQHYYSQYTWLILTFTNGGSNS
jgi:hypothetical protein